MVFIDLPAELARIKRQESEMEKIVREQTEKQMGEIYREEDAKIRRERAIRKLELARLERQTKLAKDKFAKIMSQPKLENIIL